MERKMMTRRRFLYQIIATLLGLSGLPGCFPRMPFSSASEVRNWHQSMADWDPVFGPPIQWFSRYGGPGNFDGHLRAGAAPGVDYDIPVGTPLVPSMMCYLIKVSEDWKGARFVLMSSVFHVPFQISYAHLERTMMDDRYRVAGDILKFLGKRIRVLSRGEIIALSGNSGRGPAEYGGVQPPHLHLSSFWDEGKGPYENLNPEKFGPDGGRPVYWDGASPLDVEPEKRVLLLGQTLRNLEEELSGWEKTREEEEAKETLLELSRSLGHPAPEKIQESKHFQTLKGYLKKTVLEQKKFGPGTGAYSLMLKIVSYSTDPRQEVILTLPFIAPGLERFYRRTVYEEGEFLTIAPPHSPRLL
jgi:hypothetical protein